MGTIYVGAYAEAIGDEHEGYVARVMSGGILTSVWDRVSDHVGLRACCACGWEGEITHPPGEMDGAEYERALEEWNSAHLRPLIDKAKREWWPEWARRASSRAQFVATMTAIGKLDMAADSMAMLAGDVEMAGRLLRLLAEERERPFTPPGVPAV